MSGRWAVEIPRRLYSTIAHLSPGGRRALHDALAALADDPRPAESRTEQLQGAELRRVATLPAADTGITVTLLYRVHDTGDGEPGRVEIVFLVAGP
ncbi:hypothetical protein ACIGO8_31005 [Streptomyces sp. NPDC053493]|uniref:hypothetical protein n=1 Tax=Streptomyces sp. NPDC053493 TaxID=3365705 RepID=UPI0037D86806